MIDSTRAMTFKDLITGLSKHAVGPKDGPAFIQGTAVGNERRAPAVDTLYVMGLDVDSGIFPARVVEKLKKANLAAIIYTTHSHMKGETFLLENSYNQFCKRNKLATDVVEETVKRFLIEERKWEKWIADTVAIGEVDQTAEGKGYWLSHDPMPKFRAVFPLSQPYVIAKQVMSQADAIKLWKSKLVGLAKTLDLPLDEACLDVARLFYLPRHKEGSPFEVWVTGGEALDFDGIPEAKGGGRDQIPDNVYLAAAADLAADSSGALMLADGFSLKKWARERASKFDIAQMFRTAAPNQIRDDQNTSKLSVTCPFDHNHSSAGDAEDRGGWVQSPAPELGFNTFTFACSHNACKGRDRLEMIKQAVESGWFTRADLENDDFLTGEIEKPRHDGDGGVTFFDKKDAVAAFNEVAAVLQIGSNTSYLVCQEKGEELNFKSKQATADWFANWRYEYEDKKGKMQNVPAFGVWMASAERRQYSKVVFRPDAVKNPKHYNTWTGWAIEPKQGEWGRIKRHLFEVLCDSDPDRYAYLLAWFAQMFQQPEVKPGVALVVVGKKGTGKSIVMRALRRILGDHATTLSASGALTDKFNGYMERSLLVCGEEVIWPGNRAAIGPLKAAITEPRVRLERKYVDGVEIDNFARFYLVSNEDRAIPAEGGDERRFFALKASDAHIQDTAYFAALVKEIDNGGAEAMLYDLLRYDFSGVDLRNPPKTEALAEQVESNLEGPNKWWFSVLSDGGFLDDAGDLSCETKDWETKSVTINRKHAFDAYNNAVATYGMKSADVRSVGKFISTVAPGMTTRKSGEKRWYVFPPLVKLRGDFEKIAGVRFGAEMLESSPDGWDWFWTMLDDEGTPTAEQLADPIYLSGCAMVEAADATPNAVCLSREGNLLGYYTHGVCESDLED
jgi:hypothetical protein